MSSEEIAEEIAFGDSRFSETSFEKVKCRR